MPSLVLGSQILQIFKTAARFLLLPDDSDQPNRMKTILLLLLVFHPGFRVGAHNKSHPHNDTPTQPSYPTRGKTAESQGPFSTSAEINTPENVENGPDESQALSSVLETEFADLANDSVLHAHLHEDQVFKSNPDLLDVALGESGYFIQKIFQKYGSRENALPFKGLRDLMNRLGLPVDEEILEHMAQHKHQKSENGEGINKGSEDGESMAHHEPQESENSKGVSGVTHAGESMAHHEHQESANGDGGKHDGEGMANHEGQKTKRHLAKRSVKPVVISHNHGDHSQCHALDDLLTAFHFDLLTDLNQDQFMLLCPALIDQLDNNGCRHQQQYRHGNKENQHNHGNQNHRNHDNQGTGGDSGHDSSSNHTLHHHGDVSSDTLPAMTSLNGGARKEIPAIVWAYSCISVLVISLVGLLGVAVIPIMRGVFYHSMLQFLIALAIGALSGDALLHLLPHSLSPSHPQGEDSDHDHASQGSKNSSSSTGGSSGSYTGEDDHGTVVWKGLVALLGLLFFFLAERILIILTEKRTQRQTEKKAKRKAMLLEMSPDIKDQVIIIAPSDSTGELPIRETAILSDDDSDDDNNDNDKHHHTQQHHDEASQRFLADNLADHTHHNDEGHGQGHGQGHDQGQGHGHGHSHGTGEVPRSMSAVALMVVFGDGIHNFSDGLAIGAAFANSITGGLSTAVAVFCHELPHEIGDFAMLLSSGMPWRQAMLYNVLSSVLCLLGMVVGVFLGNLDNAVLWIFPAVAGMFLYISLADMLPELKLGKEKMVTQLLTQCAGIATGSGIMLIIAVFEHDLKTLLD
ncbi:hypothetical protein ACOMHN_030200 [Nucella lapillus]